MKLRSFLGFSAPSVALMLLLLALPMVMTFWLSTRTCVFDMELVTLQQSGPFGSSEVTTQRARLDAAGQPVEQCAFVGLNQYRSVLGLQAATDDGRNEFMDALRFTLLYVAATTPFVLGGGLALALAMNRVTQRLKGVFIAASLLPFIITPVVGALAIKWMFRDNGLVPHLLSGIGVQLFWMGQAWSAQLLIILYGIWHVMPFAFIVFYAGLQGVPQDTMESATLDGASAWQKLRYVTLPHLAPLVVFVTLIHVMDAYRVFEPVVVLTQGAFTTSVQYLTYQILMQEDNAYKASAAAVLTIAGIAVLLIPLLRRTWREQRQGH
jgi:multiple sugar transport system permease protein